MRIGTGFALREVRGEFDRLIDQMERMHGDCQVKPNDSNVIQSAPATDEITLQCSPVACRVPERASHGTAYLYVVFAGSITFFAEQLEKRLLTIRYETNFGYFAVEDEVASHVLGGHYDFSPDQPAHPRAHLQLRSQADLYPIAQENFRSIAEVGLKADLMSGVLNRVRPPSAQMDFLSFMLQICADHLVDEKSSPQVVSMFTGLASSCAPVLGYHESVTDGCGCQRAPHWYPT